MEPTGAANPTLNCNQQTVMSLTPQAGHSPWMSLCSLGISWARTLSAEVSSGLRPALNIWSNSSRISCSICGPTARANMLMDRNTAGSWEEPVREARLGEGEQREGGVGSTRFGAIKYTHNRWQSHTPWRNR